MLKLLVTGNYFFAINEAGNIFSCHKSKAVIRYDELNTQKFDIYLNYVRLFDAVLYSNITNEFDVPYTSPANFVEWYTQNTGQSSSGGGGGGPYLPLAGGTLTGALVLDDQILHANNIEAENFLLKLTGFFVETPTTTFVYPVTDGTARQVLLTDGAGALDFDSLTKTDVGLSNVNNTSDDNKPISSATQTALNLKQNAPTTTTVNTTGNAITLIKSFALTTGSRKIITVIVEGKSATNLVVFSVDFTVRNIVGNTTLVGSFVPVRNTTFSPAGSTTLTLTFSGANANINVSGITATPMNWTCYTVLEL